MVVFVEHPSSAQLREHTAQNIENGLSSGLGAAAAADSGFHMTWKPFKAIHLYIEARKRVVVQFSKLLIKQLIIGIQQSNFTLYLKRV